MRRSKVRRRVSSLERRAHTDSNACSDSLLSLLPGIVARIKIGRHALVVCQELVGGGRVAERAGERGEVAKSRVKAAKATVLAHGGPAGQT